MRSFLPFRCGVVAALIFFVVAAVVLPGCARQGFQNLRQATYPVEGQVTLDGNPVANATVVFKPVDPTNFKWRETPQAKTDAEGRFTVFTYESGDGAPTGEYRVGIAVLGGGDDEGGDQARRETSSVKIPQRYGDASTSGLTAKVESKPNVLVPFELSSR